MTNVLISGVYPQRDGSYVQQKQNAKKPDVAVESACPLHATDAPTKVLRYKPTREDEVMRIALKRLNPIRSDFRLADYAQSFNWDQVTQEFRTQLHNNRELDGLPARADYEWYAVVFRSKRRADCSNADLFEADERAYTEAFESTNGALLVYWFTGLDEDHNCLATCVWSERDIARSVNSLPRHREAARLSADVYVHYNIDRYRITWVPEQETLDVAPW
ncbi:hypothetical protein GGF43_000577 [Coemansia sp. RSA 2618]|nr:hypothetical protein GGF43_000577 [Coemansia sp. RSA 2618]